MEPSMNEIEGAHRVPWDDLNNDIRVEADARNPGNGNASHRYEVHVEGDNTNIDSLRAQIQFQDGPRNEHGSVKGCTDQALLAILIDRYEGFQSGKFACRENAVVKTKLEEALMWMQKRAQDRLRRGVLGKNQK